MVMVQVGPETHISHKAPDGRILAAFEDGEVPHRKTHGRDAPEHDGEEGQVPVKSL